ncbi:PEP-CTERM sorting domain-containing protein [Adhaeretor mobilis]|uniref:Ice-binding protein C-terminal domain-containing protein n=1 Tax=Adhaeretor mobilis TaxID=1930276 RepID=A0A517N394_9BACT|nr:PEP-CTERM sorting domain-containing protein [Adhaeretor mobilis]QDT01601.1 hypothetical protein HG15A2_49480 [Adhaeretor mobilis]
MKRISIAIVLVLLASWVLQTRVQALPPDRLTSYRFLPRHSRLHQSGGFAGWEVEGAILGTFDFLEGYESLGPMLPAFRHYAEFQDVDAVWLHPAAFPGIDLDATLNLSGLDGKPLPLGAPFDAFRFTGVEGQGEPMDLFVMRAGPWLYMRGHNEPGPHTADYFNYEIRALARQTPFADLDEDDTVGASDVAMWSTSFGDSASGDVNDDGATSGLDFLSLQTQFGETVPELAGWDAAIAAASGATAATVPEPGTLLLAGLLLTMLGLLSRQGRVHSI